MENLLNTVPVQKRKVINNHVYIMKRGNTIWRTKKLWLRC
jgi:hypothetical protein